MITKEQFKRNLNRKQELAAMRKQEELWKEFDRRLAQSFEDQQEYVGMTHPKGKRNFQ